MKMPNILKKATDQSHLFFQNLQPHEQAKLDELYNYELRCEILDELPPVKTYALISQALLVFMNTEEYNTSVSEEEKEVLSKILPTFNHVFLKLKTA